VYLRGCRAGLSATLLSKRVTPKASPIAKLQKQRISTSKWIGCHAHSNTIPILSVLDSFFHSFAQRAGFYFIFHDVIQRTNVFWRSRDGAWLRL